MVLVIVPFGLKGVLKFEFIYTFQFGKGVLVAFCTGNFKINVIVASKRGSRSIPVPDILRLM